MKGSYPHTHRRNKDTVYHHRKQHDRNQHLLSNRCSLRITAFLCNSKEEQTFELSLSRNSTSSKLTIPRTSKLELNVEITNVGGLLVHDFVSSRYDQILALKIEQKEEG